MISAVPTHSQSQCDVTVLAYNNLNSFYFVFALELSHVDASSAEAFHIMSCVFYAKYIRDCTVL